MIKPTHPTSCLEMTGGCGASGMLSSSESPSSSSASYSVLITGAGGASGSSSSSVKMNISHSLDHQLHFCVKSEKSQIEIKLCD